MRHFVAGDNSCNTSTSVKSFASSASGCDEGTFSSGHGDGIEGTIDIQRADNAKWDRNVSNNVLATCPKDTRVILVRQGNVGRFEGLTVRGTRY